MSIIIDIEPEQVLTILSAIVVIIGALKRKGPAARKRRGLGARPPLKE